MKVEKETLVLGVGNLLLKDEGVGIHVIKALENEKLPAHVHLMDGGTGGLHLLSWLQGYDRIIRITFGTAAFTSGVRSIPTSLILRAEMTMRWVSGRSV